jgi:hypothetical protein
MDHCGRSILYGWAEGIKNMVIEKTRFCLWLSSSLSGLPS